MLAIIDPFSVLGVILAGAMVVGKAAKGGRAQRELERARERSALSQAGAPNRRAFASVARPGPTVRVVDFGSFPVAAWLRERGWVHDGNGVYRGEFLARGHRLRGEVHYRAGQYELLIRDPPSWATRGEHSACWRERPGGWQLLHLNVSPANVVEAIVGCQAFLQRKLKENAA
jgi:hypothetical protein